jgi:hypothetical protein
MENFCVTYPQYTEKNTDMKAVKTDRHSGAPPAVESLRARLDVNAKRCPLRESESLWAHFLLRKKPGFAGLRTRSKTAGDKSRTGDWEGDTIGSAGKNICIATFVGRKTKFQLAKVMPDKSAASLNRAATCAFAPVPVQMRNTLALITARNLRRTGTCPWLRG